jgi:hypothetical protein
MEAIVLANKKANFQSGKGNKTPELVRQNRNLDKVLLKMWPLKMHYSKSSSLFLRVYIA